MLQHTCLAIPCFCALSLQFPASAHMPSITCFCTFAHQYPASEHMPSNTMILHTDPEISCFCTLAEQYPASSHSNSKPCSAHLPSNTILSKWADAVYSCLSAQKQGIAGQVRRSWILLSKCVQAGYRWHVYRSRILQVCKRNVLLGMCAEAVITGQVCRRRVSLGICAELWYCRPSVQKKGIVGQVCTSTVLLGKYAETGYFWNR